MEIPENNRDLPEEERVCESCRMTGKDEEGKYPSNFVYGNIQHPTCVDWDNVGKYGRY